MLKENKKLILSPQKFISVSGEIESVSPLANNEFTREELEWYMGCELQDMRFLPSQVTSFGWVVRDGKEQPNIVANKFVSRKVGRECTGNGMYVWGEAVCHLLKPPTIKKIKKR